MGGGAVGAGWIGSSGAGTGAGSDGNIVRDGHCLDVRTDRCDRYGRRRRLRLRLGLGDGCRHSGHRL